MLMRSQDKKAIINLNTVSQLYIDDDNNITVDFNNTDDDGFEIIGEYSTEAIAIKVLDMIVSFCESVEWQKSYPEEVDARNFVFQMPSDKEVEE